LVEAGGEITTAGSLEGKLYAQHLAPFLYGSLASTVGAEASDILGEADVVAELGLDYANFHGFRAQLGASVPVRGDGATSISLGLSYTSFLPSPEGLYLALDGSDPTTRRLSLLLDDGDNRRPLAGVRLSGCGRDVMTDQSGTASMSGPLGSCTATIDETSLPSRALVSSGISLAPGDSLTVALPALIELSGRLRYRDSETGELLDTGAQRDVRVMIEGPVSRWKDVSLPAGGFLMEGVPVGEYRAYVVGTGETQELTLAGGRNELLLTVPVSRRSVLAPAAITPAVRVDLTSLLAAPQEPIRLGISSEAPIARVVVTIDSHQTVFERAEDAGDRFDLEVPVSPGVEGAQSVEVAIEFRQGQVARRTLQVIVDGGAASQATTASDREPRPASAVEPSDRPQTATSGSPPAVPEAGTPYPGSFGDLVRLPGSDELLTFSAPADTVSPGVTVAVYVSSSEPISDITVMNLRFLRNTRNWTLQGGQKIWRVLTISRRDAVDTLEVPIRVTFADGSVEDRVVTFAVDWYAPVPLIPGYNVPLPAGLR
jgi:hypothetical protein